jgi:hypothetical protein
MFSLINHQLGEIASLIRLLHDKKQVCINKPSYLRALQLFYVTLRHTHHELEDIYYHYVLKPQISLTQPIVLSCIWCMHMLSNKDVPVIPTEAPLVHLE